MGQRGSRIGHIVLILLGGQASYANELMPIVISLRAEITVRAARLTLGDVADIRGEDVGSTLELIRGMELGHAPRPGQIVRLPRHKVAAQLARSIPHIRSRLKWSGTDVVQVRSQGVSYPIERIALRVESFLKHELQYCCERVQIKMLDKPRQLMVHDGNVTIRPRLGGDGRMHKRMSVWADVYVDGEFFQALPFWFAVEAYQDVVVATRLLPRDYVLQLPDLFVSYRDVTEAGGTPLHSIDEAIGQRVSELIPAGNVVAKERLRDLAMVSKDQNVAVHVVSGAVDLKVRGIALGDAQLRQRVVVRNPASNESFVGTVVGFGRVEVR